MARIESGIPSLVLTLLGLLAYGSLVLNREMFLLLSLNVFLLQAVFFLLDKRKSFLLLAVYLFLLCFYYVWRAFTIPADLRPQGQWIVEQLVFSLTTIAGWLLAKTVHQYLDETENMRLKLRELGKVDEKFDVFTFQEFVEKAKMLFHGALRRNERLTSLIVALPEELDDYKLNVSFEKLCETWKQSVRSYYDVVGMLDNHRLIILLSNAQPETVQRVVDRFYRKWNGGFPVEIRHQEWDFKDWESVERQLTLWKGEKTPPS